jgi:hypothetical protein
MKCSTFISTLALTLILSSPLAIGQGEAAVPFLEITSSTQGNGMGGIARTLPSLAATAPIANPGQLGLFTLSNIINFSGYTSNTQWLPAFNFPNLTYDVTAANAGYNFRDLLSLPFGASIGIGYSRINLNLGTFTLTSSAGPTPIGTFNAMEKCESISASLGLEYFAKLGVGMNFKKIDSDLGPLTLNTAGNTKAEAKVSARDFGILLSLPLADIASALTGEDFEIVPGLAPLLDVSLGYVRSNVGGEVTYLDFEQRDPLPRTAAVGLGITAGLTAKAGNSDWKIISASIARQAEDILIIRGFNGTFEYQPGLGDLRVFDNLVLGREDPKLVLRRGWELSAAELLTIRGGSVGGHGFDYTTSGYSICLGGILKLLQSGSSDLAGTPWIKFLSDHLDVQYSSSSYEDKSGPLNGTSFAELNLVIKGVPW